MLKIRMKAGHGMGQGMSETIATHHGVVDRAILETLQDSFVTADLLRAIDAVDRSDDISEARRLRVRFQLLRLHGMAQLLVKGYAGAGIAAREPIWELAEEIAEDLAGGPADFSAEVALVERLAGLRPRDADDAR